MFDFQKTVLIGKTFLIAHDNTNFTTHLTGAEKSKYANEMLQ